MKTVRTTERHGTPEVHDSSHGGGADGRARPGYGDGRSEDAIYSYTTRFAANEKLV